MPQKERVVLLYLTTVEMIPNVGRDGLTSSGGAEDKSEQRSIDSAIGDSLLTDQSKFHAHLCKILDGHSTIVLE